MPPITGHAIGQGMRNMLTAGISGEILYSFVIIVCSLLIYIGTKELYELTSYKGIKYFRLSFLFFALAYFFRSFIKIILFYFETINLRSFLPLFGDITLFMFMYFSSIAIFYLLYSVMWKKWKSNSTVYLFHLASFSIATIILLLKNPITYLIINALLLLFISYVVFKSYSQPKKKKKHNLYIIYLMLFIFWILNIIDILIPNFLQTFQLFTYLVSLGIFLLILYKVIKKT
jgi:hypothetical protein